MPRPHLIEVLAVERYQRMALWCADHLGTAAVMEYIVIEQMAAKPRSFTSRRVDGLTEYLQGIF